MHMPALPVNPCGDFSCYWKIWIADTWFRRTIVHLCCKTYYLFPQKLKYIKTIEMLWRNSNWFFRFFKVEKTIKAWHQAGRLLLCSFRGELPYIQWYTWTCKVLQAYFHTKCTHVASIVLGTMGKCLHASINHPTSSGLELRPPTAPIRLAAWGRAVNLAAISATLKGELWLPVRTSLCPHLYGALITSLSVHHSQLFQFYFLDSLYIKSLQKDLQKLSRLSVTTHTFVMSYSVLVVKGGQ